MAPLAWTTYKSPQRLSSWDLVVQREKNASLFDVNVMY